ncbi:unnamed protein product [Acanthosepion pharaonis]|uniref:Uncharacterized protein n=1 Tax=Acanthosepion pharaonis TaxID=158019 RepID=A0A812DBH0_ACAPH|nr:unnamed protein product [Sepia pharaonis]
MLHGHTNFTSFSSFIPSSYIPPDCSLKNCLCKAILSCYMAIPTSLPFLLYSLLLHSTRLFFEELSLQGYPTMLHGHTNFTSFSSLFPSSYIPPDCSLKNCLCKGYPIMLHGHTNFTSFSSLFPSSYIPPDCSLKNCLCKAILSCYMAIPTSLPFLLYSPPPIPFHQIVL